MDEFTNIWLDWFMGYLFIVIPGIFFSTLFIVKVFELRARRSVFIAGIALVLIGHGSFFWYYYSQTHYLGDTTRINIAGDYLFVEGLLTNTGYEDRNIGLSRFREDPSTTTYSQKCFVINKRSGEIIRRIGDYQLAHFSHGRAFLVPVTSLLSYAIYDAREDHFERFFISSELKKELGELAARVDKISYDHSWILVPEMTTSGWKPAIPYFELTLSDGSKTYYDVLTKQTVENPHQPEVAKGTYKKPTPYEEFWLNDHVKALKKRDTPDGFALRGVADNDSVLWTLSADQINSEIKKDGYYFHENPGTYADDGTVLYFFTFRYGVAVDMKSGKVYWQTKI